MVFAASFFGAFEITLPSSWVNKADDASNKGGMVGIFFMAFTLSLVSFSLYRTNYWVATCCAASEDLISPAVGMFGFALWRSLFHLPYLLLSGWLNSSCLLPRLVEYSEGDLILELAFALKFLSTADMVMQWHLLDEELFLAIWVAIAFATAFYFFRCLPYAIR